MLLYTCIQLYIYTTGLRVMILWQNLPKEVLYTYSFKTHFSLPFISYINGPTAHVLNTAEVWTVSLRPLSQASLTSMSARVAFKWLIFHSQADSWPWIATQLADEFGYGFSCFAWHVEVTIKPMEVFWLFSEDIAFACHITSWLPTLHTTLPPYRSPSGIGYASKNI